MAKKEEKSEKKYFFCGSGIGKVFLLLSVIKS